MSVRVRRISKRTRATPIVVVVALTAGVVACQIPESEAETIDPESEAVAEEPFNGVEIWKAELARLTRDGTSWITSNAAYQVEDDGTDSYVMQYETLPGGFAATGCMWAVRAGDDTAPFWSFMMSWDPTTRSGMMYQVGPDGRIATGHQMNNDGTRSRSEQTLYNPDGSTQTVAHENLVEGEDSLSGESLDWTDGEWVPSRRYTWNRQPGQPGKCA